MNKKILQGIVLVVALALVAVLGYYFGQDKASDNPGGQSGNNTSDVGAFRNEGLLLRNRDGLKMDKWYLSYEADSEAKLAEMVATNEQMGSFSVGQRVAVEGKLSGEVLTVEKISAVAVNDSNNGAEVTFRKSGVYGFYGTLTLTGYLDVTRRVCNPGDMCSETVDYASFIFTSDNAAIKEFAGEYQGNSFIGDHAVGLGCQQKDKAQIFYENDADSGWKVGQITGSDYTKLINSNKDNPVQLKMTREIYTSGRGAPDCYSHFRNFDVL